LTYHIGDKKMKTHLSAHIVLACLITILTASGVITQNVYAARAGEFHVYVKNWQTEEETDCERDLAAPILTTVTVGTKAISQSRERTISSHSSYRDVSTGAVEAMETNTWREATRAAVRLPKEVPIMQFVIDPGQDQIFQTFLLFNMNPRSRGSEVDVTMQFLSLNNGDVCQFSTSSPDFNDIVVEANVAPVCIIECP
jgi:hypothetical protein